MADNNIGPPKRGRGRPRKRTPREKALAAYVRPKDSHPGVGSVRELVMISISEGPITLNGVVLNAVPPAELPRARDDRCRALSAKSGKRGAHVRNALKEWKYGIITELLAQYDGDDRSTAVEIAHRATKAGVTVTAAYVRAVRRSLGRKV